MPYATGKYAKAICDICGFSYKYTNTRFTWNHSRVCPECFNPKHPQLDPVIATADAEALFKPRPNQPAPTTGAGRVFTTNPVGLDGKTGIPLNGVLNNDSIGSSFFLKQIKSAVGAVSITTDTFSLSGQSATAQLGTITITGASDSPNLTGQAATSALGTVTVSTSSATTYTITVVGGNPSNHPYYNFGSSNKFAINGSTATADVTLSLSEGSTYRFDQSDSSNSGHPLRFSTTANGTHGGGSEYTTGVTTNGTPGSSGAYTEITVASGAPTLYYYCTNHSGMGWTANTP